MEPRKIEKLVESPGEGQTSQSRQPERKRRFQIVKLEERLAPNNGNHSIGACGGTQAKHCYRV
jgi:hypothetical protein